MRWGVILMRRLLMLVSFTLVAQLTGAPSPSNADTRPNIVLFLVDDMRADLLWAMPHVQALLADSGLTFSRSYVSNPLCCPSRSSILTGLYSHSTGVYLNGGNLGGFGAFDDHSTLATWLHAGGYQIALVGKYLNDYEGTYIPPGWDRWVAFSSAKNAAGAYYNYTLNIDGDLHSYGDTAESYSTNVLANQAVSFVQNATAPFFLFFTPFAPHLPVIPAPPDVGTFSWFNPTRSASFNEADVSDKPSWIQELPLWSDTKVRFADNQLRKQYESLQAEDRAVASLIAALDARGELDSTVFVFTSDNGLQSGEHRLAQKNAPYEASIHMPLIVRYPPLIPTPRVDSSHLVVNIDFAPTLAELAGAPAGTVEGRSLVPLFTGGQVPWRSQFLGEHLRETPDAVMPTYCEIHGERYVYTQYQGGEEELYDLRLDPDQVKNRANDPKFASLVGQMRQQLMTLCNPPPPGFVPIGGQRF
jgi:N-acetylglucosamine-6-sulfatase